MEHFTSNHCETKFDCIKLKLQHSLIGTNYNIQKLTAEDNYEKFIQNHQKYFKNMKLKYLDNVVRLQVK